MSESWNCSPSLRTFQRMTLVTVRGWSVRVLLVGMMIVSGATSSWAEEPTGRTTARPAGPQTERAEYALAIHGGAGWEPAKMTEADQAAHRVALTRALHVGRDVLAAGGSALEAVERTIRVLEDEPLYNAGRGAVFNSEGKHELDAAIMDGAQRKAGGVAGLTTVRNPISLARLVMTETRHVLLIGEGAEKFADEMSGKPGIERVANEYFSTEFRRREWRETLERLRAEDNKPRAEKKTSSRDRNWPNNSVATTAGDMLRNANPFADGKCTVGCVALDQSGNLAAGTSTGGLTNKKWGRVGAVPIVGAGTYADNRTCAVSGTGTGEIFLLNSVAYQIHSLMELRELSLAAAVKRMFEETLPEDSGGVIAVDRLGRVTMRCNTPGMARAAIDSRGTITIAIDR
ncbi:MAG: isoaspartyl peptidase/L-asparaginase [Pirellulales bacterium]